MDVVLQSRTSKYGIGRIHPKTAAGHGCIALLLLSTVKNGGITLAQRKREFESRWVRVVVSDSDVIDVTFDKWRTAQFLKRAGIGTPRTWLTLEGVLDALRAGEVQFPLVVKPRWGSASIGIEYVQNEEELRLVYSLARIRLRRSIWSKVSER